jgi:hypothetical protein
MRDSAAHQHPYISSVQDYTQILARLEDYILYPPQKGATEPCEIDNVSFELLSFPAVHSQS